MTASLFSNVVPLGRAKARRLRPLSQTAAMAMPLSRGYFMLYRSGIVNHCPGCGQTHWYVGNRTAECAFCATALDLQRV